MLVSAAAESRVLVSAAAETRIVNLRKYELFRKKKLNLLRVLFFKRVIAKTETCKFWPPRGILVSPSHNNHEISPNTLQPPQNT